MVVVAAEVQELARLEMHSNCDAVEMCADGSRFVVATYELQEDAKEPVRHGSITLFSCGSGGSSGDCSSSSRAEVLEDKKEDSFCRLSTCPAPAGVLDVKFCPTTSSNSSNRSSGGHLASGTSTTSQSDRTEMFAMPLADGSVRLGCVRSDDNELRIVASSPPIPGDIALAVTWEPTGLHGGEAVVAAAFSSGYLRQYSVVNSDTLTSAASSEGNEKNQKKEEAGSSEGALRLTAERQVHDLEAWAVSRDRGKQIYYSGSDDGTLRQTSFGDGTTNVVRRFAAGVTAIEADPQDDQCLLVGTYEDRLYQFDLRMARTPLQEVDVGGGVWRIKQSPFCADLLAVAGMYAGAFVIDRSLHEWAAVGVYGGHKSMCYGVTWKDTGVLLSCSFYDKLLAMWKFSQCG